MTYQTDQAEKGYKPKILEPVFNKDIPSDAELAQINILGSEFNAFAAPDAVQQYGCTLQYKFPDYPENMQLGTYGPDSTVYTNQIFDINIDTTIHPHIFHPEGNQLSKTPVATDWDKFTGTVSTSQGASSTGAQVYYYADDAYVFPQSQFLNFFVYVVPKSRQRLLGDWIQRNLAGDNDVSGYQQGQLKHTKNGVTTWQFDDFCDAVRPIFARYCYWESTAVTSHDYLKYRDGVHTDRKMRDPRQGSVIDMGEVKNRDFHLFAGTEEMHPTDAYASKLLIGTMGPFSTNIFSYCHLDIIYKKVAVKASELYWRNHQPELGPVISRGSRRAYGNADWDITQSFGSLSGQNNINGVLACSVGDLDVYEGGKLNKKDDKTNILLDTTTSSGDWY